MPQTVDARGLDCPLPVINASKALENNDTIMVIVDNSTAIENIRRMSENKGYAISSDTRKDGIYITIDKTLSKVASTNSIGAVSPVFENNGMRVLVVSQDTMGKGSDDLGKVLIKSFFHTLAETDPSPDTLIFLNSGVKLVAGGSEVIEDIKVLEHKGKRILACGTCLDFFKLKEKLLAGKISNMYEIKELMLTASSTINL
jgi:selenium metabolism protein YedF